jgi:hypothetical protein
MKSARQGRAIFAGMTMAAVLSVGVVAEELPAETREALNAELQQAREQIAVLTQQVAALQRQLNRTQPNQNGAPAAAPTAPVATVNLQTLVADYAANRGVADQKYRNRQMTISSTVESLEKETMKPGYFSIFLKSPDPKVRVKLIAEFASAFDFLRDKIGYRQSDVKFDLMDQNSRIAMQMTNTLKSSYYPYDYYYNGNRRTIDKQKSEWLTVIARGQTVTVEAVCLGKSVSVDFGNCKFVGLEVAKVGQAPTY